MFPFIASDFTKDYTSYTALPLVTVWYTFWQSASFGKSIQYVYMQQDKS